MTGKYYLDTNAIYSLINNFDEFTNNENVIISHLAIREILFRIEDEKQFFRRKSCIEKIKKHQFSYIPITPFECFGNAFGIDLSNSEFVKLEKEAVLFFKELILDTKNFSDYRDKIKESKYNNFISEYKKVSSNTKKRYQDRINIKSREYQYKKNNPRIVQIDLNDFIVSSEKAKEINDKVFNDFLKIKLKLFLETLNFEFDDKILDFHIGKYNDCLNTYFLGNEFYDFYRAYYSGSIGKNDFSDIHHLLYLHKVDRVIVTDDKLFSKMTFPNQRLNVKSFKENVLDEKNYNYKPEKIELDNTYSRNKLIEFLMVRSFNE